MRAVGWALLVSIVAGCVDADPPALRTLCTVIATQDGQPVAEATERLAGYGRRALVVVEAALHTADARGRRQLVHAIDRIGDRDAVPLLRHLARYDDDERVQRDAAALLARWGVAP